MLLICTAAPALADTRDAFLTAKDEWGLFTGYGETIPGMGATRSRVEAIDLVGRYGYFLTGEIGGDSWYRGRHEFAVELPVSYVYSPESAVIVGLHFFAIWNFTSPKGFVPYVFGGGGPVYTNLHVPELSREWDGSYQFGAGVKWPTDMELWGRHVAVDLNCRYHHISNAGTSRPNGPLNSIRLRLGLLLL